MSESQILNQIYSLQKDVKSLKEITNKEAPKHNQSVYADLDRIWIAIEDINDKLHNLNINSKIIEELKSKVEKLENQSALDHRYEE